ncbi:dienelactone hydrolase [Roseobacter sp. HKCCD9010]|uniref:alpha/beta hydrolase family protein n=1 Tax=unclassified Roseobacter TaxID=196798 RepID=UPI00149124DC|nr:MULTISPECIES: dienelactone hydrolase [unclassified Roseobacter]MBF9052236.1 dienelactone hydrolase [Rhodobacterales bacterium HKCCD4356]NNV14075.1 dienelactone hydrolase [Roseobacter sp. HKCCD7357]NNV18396.1 dienelactone hydrolase [Roseobacter sp. HKCCD8768]NNV27835.1 dienelactone hydrolase [Roseobacter sp. HKCCD8192]NNV32173.1 dienelactone hydrolase [Roseobacter sp. HKCCD9061]
MSTCGYRTGVVQDKSRSNWQNSGARLIAWTAWYPAQRIASAKPPEPGFFVSGDVALDAPLAGLSMLPIVLMSHGTGGTAESLGWLARYLAGAGYVVLAANHHGNTGLEPYTAEGFVCWWERASDLSFLLSYISQDSFFGDRLDLDQTFAVGFSLGGYTVLKMAGAQSSMDEFQRWRTENGIVDVGPREFPNAGANVSNLISSSAAFRASWARSSDDFTDKRVKSIAAIAPAPTVRAFTRSSVSEIAMPVLLITGGNDAEAPSEHCADWLMAQNVSFDRVDLGREVGHYTFLDFPSDRILIGKDPLFTDHEGVYRAEVHNQSAASIHAHFS